MWEFLIKIFIFAVTFYYFINYIHDCQTPTYIGYTCIILILLTIISYKYYLQKKR